MVKYVKVTDDEAVGYHSVENDFKLPHAAEHESYEFVSAADARKAHPALFGKDPAPAESE